jgi:anti-repressor protein
MTELMPFDYEGQTVRTVLIDGEPEFVAADVCRVLEHSNPSAAVSGLDDDERGLRIVETPSGNQQMVTITEAGLYSLIIRSRKPEAKAFRRWITHTVLPQIRKTGSYGVAPVRELTRLELIEIAREAELGRLAAEEQVAELTATNAELEPKAKTFDTFLSTKGDYSVGEAAKILSREHGILTGEKRLFAFMLQLGWIYRDAKRKPVPYQAQVDNGRLVAKARFWFNSETGEPVADAPQVRITAKGLDALRQKYLDARKWAAS